MESRRDYLVRLGLAKPGRGRMSAEAHAAIDKAIADGMRFSDMPNSGNADKPIASKDASKVSTPGEFFGETPSPIFNGGWYRIDAKGKRIEVDGRTACGKCRYSLDYQNCDNPIAVDNIGNLVPVMR